MYLRQNLCLYHCQYPDIMRFLFLENEVLIIKICSMVKVVVTRKNFLYYYPLFEKRMLYGKIHDYVYDYHLYLRDGYSKSIKEKSERFILKELNDLLEDDPYLIKTVGYSYVDGNFNNMVITERCSKLGSEITIGDMFKDIVDSVNNDRFE